MFATSSASSSIPFFEETEPYPDRFKRFVTGWRCLASNNHADGTVWGFVAIAMNCMGLDCLRLRIVCGFCLESAEIKFHEITAKSALPLSPVLSEES